MTSMPAMRNGTSDGAMVVELRSGRGCVRRNGEGFRGAVVREDRRVHMWKEVEAQKIEGPMLPAARQLTQLKSAVGP